jgi:signal transduction histidine kinase
MGVLLVAPFLLSLLKLSSAPVLTFRAGIELAALLLATAVITYLLFLNDLRLEYLVLPLIMAAALRFHLRGAAPAALIASGVAVVCAVNGVGPFAEETLLQKMITLQVFNVSVALASFVLASFVETRERKEEMARLYASAQLANEAKTRFLHMAAHELRTPITVLTGYLSLLSEGSMGEVPKQWRKALDILSTKTSELNRLVADLLEASRLEASAAPGVRSLVDLPRLAEEAADRARPRAALLGGVIDLKLPQAPVLVEVDSSQISRVLDNLINNGLTYTIRPPKVSLSLETNDQAAVLKVADNGVGIRPEEKDRIFDQFHRSNDPEFANVPGTGLGLYISRQLAVVNGGSLLLEQTSPSEGTVFALAVPIVTSAGPASGDHPGAFVGEASQASAVDRMARIAR